LRDFSDGRVYECYHTYLFVICFSASIKMDPTASASASAPTNTENAAMEGNSEAGSNPSATGKKPVVVLVIGMAGSVSATVSCNFKLIATSRSTADSLHVKNCPIVVYRP
jgi:hypothetical protein